MDRISALRNVEDALADFESGEADLQATERRVLNVLRTYATEFEDEELSAYRASGGERTDGLVVVAESETQARTRVEEIVAPDGPANGSAGDSGDGSAGSSVTDSGEDPSEPTNPTFEIEPVK